MLNKIKKIIISADKFLYKKFGSDKSFKVLENIKETKIIFSHLNISGEDSKVKFVGGCVRKVFCGESIDDIDLATSYEPDEVKRRLIKNDIKVIDTGISHGTITAILNKKKFEITTLRKDISTDGRHADVQFTLDWEKDASRRDFTINAIYLDIEGRIFDPLNGIEDLQKGKINFIGNSEERIKEDYLRILRYFRFFAQYSKTTHEEDTIKSIRRNINGLNKISNERIFNELSKILKLKNLYSLFLNKDSKEIILNIFSQFKYYERLKAKIILNNAIRNKYDDCLILALLLIDKSNDYEYFCHKYRVSNDIKMRLKNISKNYENLGNKNFYKAENFKRIIYKTSKNEAMDLLLFSKCLKNNLKNKKVDELINYVNNCEVPKFPISGNYLKIHGYKTGKELGNKLKSLEEWWIDNNFFIDKKEVEKFLEKNVKN
jgi:poly(A) polymerase